MANLDATTPQLRAIKGIADAYTSRDLKGLEPILSRDFIFKTFPKSSEFPDLTKEEYIQRYGLVTALLAGVELVFHEVIEAQGKAVTNVTFLFTTTEGTTIDYDSLIIFTFVDEDGEVKVLEAKDFSDPEKRKAFHVEAAKILSKGTPVA